MDDVFEKYPSLSENKKQYNKFTIGLKEYIDELYDKLMLTDQKGNPISNMDFSRYPFSKDYQNHFYIRDTANVVVDLENFVDRFKEIGDNLDSLTRYFKNLVDNKIEADCMEREYYETQQI